MITHPAGALSMTDPNDTLNLQAWKAEVIPPARFQSEVWQRIAARTPARRSLLDCWLERLVLLVQRPLYAMALVAVSIGLGLGLGYTTADNARSVGLQEGQSLYMASINPLSHTGSSLE